LSHDLLLQLLKLWLLLLSHVQLLLKLCLLSLLLLLLKLCLLSLLLLLVKLWVSLLLLLLLLISQFLYCQCPELHLQAQWP
jgi:hypothetical protein